MLCIAGREVIPMSTSVVRNHGTLALGFVTTPTVRERLSALLGADWEVLDIRSAPPTADVVMVGPCSPQGLIGLRRDFPRARVIVVEVAGEADAPDACRCLSAGAASHVVVRGVADLAAAALSAGWPSVAA
jgi:hypothetical protein